MNEPALQRALCQVFVLLAFLSPAIVLGQAPVVLGQAPPAYVGTYYQLTVSAPAIPATPTTPASDFPCDCTIQLAGTLPSGLTATYGTSSITISGTPTQATAGTDYRFLVLDKNKKASVWVVNLEVALNLILFLPGQTTVPASIPRAVKGKPYLANVVLVDDKGKGCKIDGSYTAELMTSYGFPATVPDSGALAATQFGGQNILDGLNPAVFKFQCAGQPALTYPDMTILNTSETATAKLGDPTPGAEAAAIAKMKPVSKTYDGLCDYAFSDCEWQYTLVGGVEQSDLSAQNTETLGFVDLFVRAPWNTRPATVWLRARFLGAPNTSNTQNIVSVATDPTGSITASSLSTVGFATDYMIGLEHDFFQPTRGNPRSGQFTWGLIAGFGATTPLSAQSATVAYLVPAYGTNECTVLQQRFGAGNSHGYSPSLPGGGSVTTTTTVTGSAPTTSTSNNCVVQPTPQSSSTTTGGVTTTIATSATPITAIAFSPEDRSSFLLKYMFGVRLTTRFATDASGCSSKYPCSRSRVDLTFGQDQAITGGYLRRTVFKADAIFPILSSGVYFFGSASTRIAKNNNLSPLILTQATLSTTSTPGGITIPSPSVFVLPLKQSDRDFYRIGIGVNLDTVLTKLFKK